MEAASATSRARQGRSTSTVRTGSPAVVMASRMVPLPEASAPMRTGPGTRCTTGSEADVRDAPGPTGARYQRRTVPELAPHATLQVPSGTPVLLSPDTGTGATWPDRPASGIGPTSL